MEEGDFDLPVAKRQRLVEEAEPVAPPRGSRLFTPFRVSDNRSSCSARTDAFAECRTCISHFRALHIRRSWEDDLSDHHLCWAKLADV